MMTSFGFNDSGGGTTVPRLAARELARRGWEVTVFHAAVAPLPGAGPYALSETVEQGVRLVGVHNRPHGLFDLGHPERELDDPPIREAFARELDRNRPDVVHFHNLHNLGASLIDHAAARGIPAYFTTHNYWLICPRAYLIDGGGSICAGPGDGTRCGACVATHDARGHRRRLEQIRATAHRGLTAVMAVSEAVRTALINCGYAPELVDVVRQAMPHETEIWQALGRGRRPGRVGDRLTVGFLGSALPHKGPQLLVDAAQRAHAPVDVRIFGEIPPGFERALRAADRRGVVTIEGAFAPGDIAGLLAGVDACVLPSMWWDCAPLAAAEALAARTPLLVPRLGGLPEAIREGIDGLTFAGGGAADLARQLDRLAADDGLLERLQAQIAPPREFSAYVDELEAYYAGERPSHRAATRRGAAAPSVRWQGDHGLPTSLSIINDRVTERLGTPVQRVATDGSELDRALPHLADVEVRHQWPPDLSPARAGALALIQPWEFGSIPAEWLEPMRANVDELWVPSEYVRAMYLRAGIDPARVVVVPNGVDCARFTPDGPRLAIEGAESRLVFLFVGGLIPRKGADLLLDAWTRAFADRDDVLLAIKDFGVDGVYRAGERAALRAHAESGALPKIVFVDDTLTGAEMAGLMRACDVLVHPYRGEGFAMPVLEAMASGRPVITTAGGPTDEFMPETAGWRIRSDRVAFAECRIGDLPTVDHPWWLTPDLDHLISLLREAADDPAARAARGRAGREAARSLDWDRVVERYRARIDALEAASRIAAGPAEPYPLEGEAQIRLLATPAWRGEDRLGELLGAWSVLTDPTTDARLYLLADPSLDGTPEELERRVRAAAAQTGADLEDCADIDIVMAARQGDRDARVQAAVDGFVVLHAACAGQMRAAQSAGRPVLKPDARSLATLLGRAPDAPAAQPAAALSTR